MELPVLTADFICEDTTMRIYANDVIFNQNYKESTKLIFQNYHTCPTEVEVVIDDPLKIVDDNQNQNEEKHIFVVQPSSYLKVEQ